MRRCFTNIDILNSQMTTKPILNPGALDIIRQMNLISATLTNAFMDYFIRRCMCELLNRPFIDVRANKFYDPHVVITDTDNDTWEFPINPEYNGWYIREKLDYKSKKIGTMEPGEKFVVMSSEGIWMKIFYKNIVGYVRAKVPDCQDFHEVNESETFVNNPYFVPFEQNFHFCQFGCSYKMFEKSLRNADPDACEIPFCSLPICQHLCYKLAQDTDHYATESILPDLFILSLYDTEVCSHPPTQEQINSMFDLLSDEILAKRLAINIQELCEELLQGKQSISFKKEFGNNVLRNGKKEFSASVDLVTDSTVYDIHCSFVKSTEKDEIYQLQKLLGYASLFALQKEPIQITNLCVLNLCEGQLTTYNINYISQPQLEAYFDTMNPT